MQVAGIEKQNWRFLKTSFDTNFAIDPAVFEEAVKKDLAAGLVPSFLCATVRPCRLTLAVRRIVIAVGDLRTTSYDLMSFVFLIPASDVHTVIQSDSVTFRRFILSFFWRKDCVRSKS